MKNDKHPYFHIMLAGFGAIALSILFFFALFRLKELLGFLSGFVNLLSPFVIGGAIAYLLKPICNWLEATLGKALPAKMQKLVPGLSTVLSLLFFLLCIYLLVIMILPQTITSVIALIDAMPARYRQFTQWLNALMEDSELWASIVLPDGQTLPAYLNSFSTELITLVTNWTKTSLLPNMQSLLYSVTNGVVNVVNAIKNLLIGLVTALYFLSIRKRLAEQGKLLLNAAVGKTWATHILNELRYADRCFDGFLSGKVVDSLIIGLLCYICCALLRIPSALLVSVIVGVTNIIPFFGPFIGAVPSAFLILIANPIKALWFVIMIIALQQLDGNVIGPKILGESVGLSSFWILFSILLFGGMFGFVGMIIGVPLFAVIYDIIYKVTSRLLEKRNLGGMMEEYHQKYARK